MSYNYHTQQTTSIIKILFGAILTYSALAQLFQHQAWWFIQNVNLIFHEAGHMILGLLGDFIGLIGGSLFEILIPTIVTLHFMQHRYWLSTAFGCWWLSTALLSVSIYASDAQERLLPLLGGDAVLHDWHHILSQIGLLQYDNIIGYIFWLLGLTCVGLSLLFLSKDRDVSALLHRHTLR